MLRFFNIALMELNFIPFAYIKRYSMLKMCKYLINRTTWLSICSNNKTYIVSQCYLNFYCFYRVFITFPSIVRDQIIVSY